MRCASGSRHRRRRGDGWQTVEAPLELAALLQAETRPILVDSLTLWLTNIMLAEKDVETKNSRLIAAVRTSRAEVLSRRGGPWHRAR